MGITPQPFDQDELYYGAFPGGSLVKSLPANAGDGRDAGSIPGSGRPPAGGGHGNPLQYSCLENPMDRGAWRAIVHSVTELGMTEQLSMAQLYIYFFFCKNEQIFSPVLSYLHQR